MQPDPASPFVRAVLIESEPAPPKALGPLAFLRRQLLGGWDNAALTILSIYLLWIVIPPLARFLVVDAVWTGNDREACLPERVGHAVGACWPFIAAKLGQFIYGFYPSDQLWRVNLVFLVTAGLVAPLLAPGMPGKRINAAAFLIVLPVAGSFLLLGGAFGLPYVPTSRWGGLLVTLVIAVTGIVASLPMGVALALGRRSRLPIVRALSVAFIEFWRGVPLITVLFFATYMLPLFLPGRWSIDSLLRALIGVALFAAASMAEVVRGGLQAIPRGQYEAAQALGLGYWRMMAFVILPQTLRLVIPGIVNIFISLFKDTTLVQIVAIFDFLGQIRAAFSDPTWATPTTLFTGFAFAGAVYFAFCFAMSRYSQFLERHIGRGGASLRAWRGS
jgi:general L-amino acid transport system permease protein